MECYGRCRNSMNGNARYFWLELEEEDFETLGLKFGLSYKGAAALATTGRFRKSESALKEVTKDFECLLLSAKAGNEGCHYGNLTDVPAIATQVCHY